MPWANGRGTSYEVARSGGEPWNWRVAIAPVVEPGPFSSLPGIDRQLVVMDDAALAITIDGVARFATRGEVVGFAGESIVVAQVPDGPTRDCGLMVRRGVASGAMVVASQGALVGRLVVAIDRSVVGAEGQRVELDAGDALVGESSMCVEVDLGLVCVIEVAP